MRLRCRIFGHKLKWIPSQRWNRRRMRYVDCNYGTCARCGCGEPEVWAPGWTGTARNLWYAAREWPGRLYARVHRWLFPTCAECGKPLKRGTRGVYCSDECERNAIPF